MYTVSSEHLPVPGRTAEAIELMTETLSWTTEAPHLQGLLFVGDVFHDTDDPDQFEVLSYKGLISSIILEPPTFNLVVAEARKQVSQCDCPGADIDLVFDDFPQAMEEAQLSQDLDDFAGTPTDDPHFESLPLSANTEISVRFDRLGAYGVQGVFKKAP